MTVKEEIKMKFDKNFEAPWPFPKTKITFEVKHWPQLPDTGETLRDLGAKVFHGNNGNGTYQFTAVYRPCVNGNAKMYEVALAWCAPDDTYNRKIGVALALNRFKEGNTVLLPLGVYSSPESALQCAFGVLV